MPQPIRTRCHAEITGLLYRPKHAEVLGHIVGISGRLEAALGWLLAFLSRGSATITVSMFHAVVSTDAQRAMLHAAAKQSLRGQELDAFNDLMEDFKPRYGERSKLIHNIWGHSNDHPDKALWWKASDLGTSIAMIAAAPDAATMDAVGRQEDFSLKAMTYSVKDLQEVVVRLDEYRTRVTEYVIELWNAHPALVSLTNASTNTPPTGGEPQLDLHQNPQTDP